MKSIRNLIFDLDGTLIDSSEGVVDAVNYSLRMMGEPEQSPERIKTFIGYPLTTMYPHFSKVSPLELCEHFKVRAAETVISSTAALDGADKTLRELHKAGYKMAIATTKITCHLRGIVDLLNWSPLFDALVGGDEVKQVKPAPEPFILALERLGVSAEHSLVIGDTFNDVMAAKAVPMLVAEVASPYGAPKGLPTAEPDFRLDSISGVLALLDGSRPGRKAV